MNVSENENVVFRVQVWLNGIVEAFEDGNREMPIKPQITHHPMLPRVNSRV